MNHPFIDAFATYLLAGDTAPSTVKLPRPTNAAPRGVWAVAPP